MRKIIILLGAFTLNINFISAQDELQSSLSDYIEGLMEEESSKIDYEEFLEEMEQLSEHIINLNTATERELSGIPFLSTIDIQNILIHKKTYGDFQTLYELKNIPDFDLVKIKKILPFVTIEVKEKERGWRNELKNGKQTIYHVYQQNLEEKKGYKRDEEGNKKYAGQPFRYYIKYQYQTAERISIGCLGEKDAGEAAWSTTNKGFDFTSMYLQANNIWRIKQINIGDYNANFGQGLVIGNSSLFGKSSNTTISILSKEGLKKHSSCNENNFLRGAGVTFGIKSIESTLFVSHRKKDANISNHRITSFKTDGLHRTENEISKKRNITENILGVNLTYKRGQLQAGITALFYHYSDTLSPANLMYNHFRISDDNQHFNIGVNYKYNWKRISLFGESAINAYAGFATLNGLSIRPNSRLNLLVIERMYQPHYQANYSNAFGENSRTENEHGLYIGTQLLPIKKITLSMYSDVYVFPWAKYNINYPSRGQDYLVHIHYNKSKKLNIQLKYKYKEYIEQHYTKQNLRYANHISFKHIKLQSLIEGNKVATAENESYGWALSEDIQLDLTKARININMHHAYFMAEEYNNRFYFHEKDILNTFSMPQLYGKGHRIDINVKWLPNKLMQVYFNYGIYIYTDGRESIGSSYEQITGNKSSMVKALIKWRF